MTDAPWFDPQQPMGDRITQMADAIESGTAELPADALTTDMAAVIAGAYKLLAERRGGRGDEAIRMGRHLREELLVAAAALKKHGSPYSAERAAAAARGERYKDWKREHP